MKARVPVSKSTKKEIRSEIRREWEKYNEEKTRKMIKLFALAYREEDKAGAKRIYRVIERIDKLCDEERQDEIFWEHTDRVLIDELGLPFDREEYDYF